MPAGEDSDGSSAAAAAGKSVQQDLQRHLSIELRIGRLVDLAHASLADEGGHVVVRQPGADF